MNAEEMWAVKTADGVTVATGPDRDTAWAIAWMNLQARGSPSEWIEDREANHWTCTRGEWRAL